MNFSFNATQFQPNYGGSNEGGLPPGKHKVILESAELTPSNKNPQNSYLKFKLKCIEGLSQGGVQIDRINIYNNDQTAVKIANEQLAAYCAVMGKQGFNQITEIYNIPFYIEVAPQRDNPQYTEVKTYYDLNGNQPGKNASAAQVGGAPNGGPPAGFSGGGNGAPAQGWTPPTETPAPIAIDPAPTQQWSGNPGGAAPAAAPWSPAPGGGAPGWAAR